MVDNRLDITSFDSMRQPADMPLADCARRLAVSRWSLNLADVLALLGVFAAVRRSMSDLSITWYSTDGGIMVSHVTKIDPFLVIGLLCIVYFRLIGIYNVRRPLWDAMRPVARVLTTAFAFDALLLLASGHPYAIGVAVGSWGALLVAIPMMRGTTRLLLNALGYWRLPTVVIGTGENAREAAEAIRAEFALGLDIRLFVDCSGDPTPARTPVPGTGVVPISEELLSWLRDRRGPHVLVALEESEAMTAADLMTALAVRPHAIDVVPSMRGVPLFGMEVNHLLAHEVLLLRVRNNLARTLPRMTKRLIDLVGASLILLLISPVLLVLSLLVARTGGPVFYGHKRIGYGGREFHCLKFRSMVTNSAEVLQHLLDTDPQARAEWERDFKLKNDPRITRVGGFLRRTSLDELPQLFNVIRGEMSLVGPRPVIEEELERYGRDKDYYLMVRPGITGLWQVSGRSDIDYKRRVSLDSWYVKNWSLWYDIFILLRTVSVVVAKQGAY